MENKESSTPAEQLNQFPNPDAARRIFSGRGTNLQNGPIEIIDRSESFYSSETLISMLGDVQERERIRLIASIQEGHGEVTSHHSDHTHLIKEEAEETLDPHGGIFQGEIPH
jgi:hypothetical protein